MRCFIIREVFLKELRETLRDRRSLLVTFGVPLVLYPALTLGAAALGASKVGEGAERARRPQRVVVINGASAPGLLERLRAKESGVALVSPEHPEEALRDGQV